MVVMNSGLKMPGGRRHCPRINTYEMKLQLERKIGHHKAEKYFSLLSRFLSLKLTKSEFDKLCIGIVGRENIHLHNGFIRAIIKNACSSSTPPSKPGKADLKVQNGHQRSSLESLCRDVLPKSPRRVRTPTLRDRRIRDRPTPLEPNGMPHHAVCENSIPSVQKQPRATELLCLGNRNPVEEGAEDVDKGTGSRIYSRSPVRAPFGVFPNVRRARKVSDHGSSPSSFTETCQYTRELPDATSLKKRLERTMEMEGLDISMDCISLLNSGLNAYMRTLIKPSLEFAALRSENQPLKLNDTSVLNGKRSLRCTKRANSSFSVSVLDFRTAVEVNPRILGEDWPVQLEKLRVLSSEDCLSD